MKNILLLVHDDAGQESRLQTALDLVRALGGHLTCVDVAMMPAVAGDLYDGGYGGAMLLADEREREDGNKRRIEARLVQEDVPWNWIDTTGNAADCVIDASGLADLIVANRKLDAMPHPDMRDITSRILMHVRKPVVAVPDSLRRFDMERALIAWDGQESVAATMRACVPLLKLARDVRIWTAPRSRSASNAEEAAEYLSRHGIGSEVRFVIDDGLRSIDTCIMDECAQWKPGYVLMGAYNHGRLVQAFGGVTKRMLANSAVPLILGH